MYIEHSILSKNAKALYKKNIIWKWKKPTKGRDREMWSSIVGERTIWLGEYLRVTRGYWT